MGKSRDKSAVRIANCSRGRRHRPHVLYSLYAATMAGGELISPSRGAHVSGHPDHDEEGKKGAKDIAEGCSGDTIDDTHLAQARVEPAQKQRDPGGAGPPGVRFSSGAPPTWGPTVLNTRAPASCLVYDLLSLGGPVNTAPRTLRFPLPPQNQRPFQGGAGLLVGQVWRLVRISLGDGWELD
jgi:hypothetical protein